MDEQEIEPISRIFPLRKLAFARPARGGREQKYQVNQYHKTKKPKKPSDVSKGADVNDIPNSDDYVAELKKRIGFDRATIIGD